MVIGIVYLPTLDGDFLHDDYGLAIFTEDGKASWEEGLRYFFPSHLTRDQFLRPIPVMAGVLDLAFWGGNPFGFHLTNLLIHLVGALLVGRVAARLARNPRAGPLAMLCYGLYPGHVESVAWIIHRMVGLCVVFSMLAILLHLRSRWRPLAWSAALAALLCKEPAAILPAAIAIVHILDTPGGRPWHRVLCAARAAVPYGMVVGAYLVWKHLAFGSLVTGYGDHDSYFGYFVGEKIYLDIPASLLRFLSPVNSEVVPALCVWLHAAVAALGLAALLWYGPGMKQTRSLIFFGGALAVLSLVLVFPFLSVTGGLTNSRHFSPPAMGLALALGGFLAGLSKRGRVLALVGLAVYCLPLIRNLAPYQEAGRMARAVRRGLEKRLAGYPEGTRVLVAGVPAMVNGASVFGYGKALQGALNPPFASRKLHVEVMATMDDPTGDPDNVLLTLQGPCTVLSVVPGSGKGPLEVREVQRETGALPETVELLDPIKGATISLRADPGFVFRSAREYPYYRLVFKVGPVLFPVTAARGKHVVVEAGGRLVYRLSQGDIHENNFLDRSEVSRISGPVTWWVEGVEDHRLPGSAVVRSRVERFHVGK